MTGHCVQQTVLPDDQLERIIKVWHRFPFYDAVNQRPSLSRGAEAPQPAAASSEMRSLTSHTDASTPALPGRFPGLMGREDVDSNYRLHGPPAYRAAIAAGLARHNYFGANYVFHDEVSVPGIESFLNHEEFIEAARATYDLPLVVPTHLYANVMLPGQELPVHTDIPEFIGADRTQLPMWLLVVMHHSGLFDDRRIASATAVAYAEHCAGGEFAYYESADKPAVIAPTAGGEVVFDADSVFHAVLPIGADTDQPPLNRSFMRLHRQGNRQWRLTGQGSNGPETMATYSSDDLRFSVSRKAYCFADRRQYESLKEGKDHLEPEVVLRKLTEELVERGALESAEQPLSDLELATTLINEFVHFPRATAQVLA